MPFHRACYLTHPTTGELGLWLELSDGPKGQLIGGVWPNVNGQEPLIAYNNRVNALYNQLCRRTTNQVVIVTITFISLSPLTLDPLVGVVVSEGDYKTVHKLRVNL